ncbi:unnamed protein product [Alopecurus aequalis]
MDEHAAGVRLGVAVQLSLPNIHGVPPCSVSHTEPPIHTMGAVLSIAAVYSAVRATRNYARRSLMTPDAPAADWTGLPEDLLLIVMAALDIPSLTRSGAVCTSWRDACNTFRLRTLKQAPCLLYACDAYGFSDAALYCPSTDSTFRVPYPGPTHEKRGFVFSCNGWVFAADESGNPYLFNPITGVQAALPPLQTIRSGRDENLFCNYFDDDGKRVYKADIEDPSSGPFIVWARHTQYSRVAISSAAEVTECTVLIVHRPESRLSYARPGDKRWTLVPDIRPCVADVLYNERNGLFYILLFNGSILTLDLNGPSPELTMILPPVTKMSAPTMYLALTPSGELLQLWRVWDLIADSSFNKDLYTHQNFVKNALEDRIDFATDDDNKECSEAATVDRDTEVPQGLDDEVSTTQLLVFKVDIGRQKLLELRDIGDHALFLGLNASICLPTKDFSGFESNCAYLTDDCIEYSRTLRNDRGIWNIKKRSMDNIDDVLACFHPCLALPAPIWIRPRF